MCIYIIHYTIVLFLSLVLYWGIYSITNLHAVMHPGAKMNGGPTISLNYL